MSCSGELEILHIPPTCTHTADSSWARMRSKRPAPKRKEVCKDAEAGPACPSNESSVIFERRWRVKGEQQWQIRLFTRDVNILLAYQFTACYSITCSSSLPAGDTNKRLLTPLPHSHKSPEKPKSAFWLPLCPSSPRLDKPFAVQKRRRK